MGVAAYDITGLLFKTVLINMYAHPVRLQVSYNIESYVITTVIEVHSFFNVHRSSLQLSSWLCRSPNTLNNL